MFCEKCGKQIPDNTNLCSYCGEKREVKSGQKAGMFGCLGVVVIFILLAIIGGTGEKTNSINAENPSNQEASTQESKSQVTKINYLFTTQNVIQEVYKKNSESKGIGVPEVDCSFAEHWENNDGGLVYVKGSFTLGNADKIKHSYTARYGSGTNDIVYLAIDGQKILSNIDKQAEYMDKFSAKNK